MKLAIMQPYLFPYLGYYQLISAVDRFVILNDVNYINKGWINRNRILSNGKATLFTVPLKKSSQNKKINECELSDIIWKEKLLKTIEYSYKRAPFFNEVYELISSLILYEEVNLSRWLTFQIKSLCVYLEIPSDIIETSGKYENGHLKAQGKIIDICLKEKADIYINPSGGKDLYQKEVFARNNIKLNFLKVLPCHYEQFNKEFVPDLSIIDMLMFNSKSRIKEQLTHFELI